MQMPDDPLRYVRPLIPIAVGTVFFLIFVLLCFYRELGPRDPSGLLFGTVMAISVVTTIIGLIEAGGHVPSERGFGIALAVEGGVLLFLTLVAWVAMGPVPMVTA
jgi:hypothetical protein